MRLFGVCVKADMRIQFTSQSAHASMCVCVCVCAKAVCVCVSVCAYNGWLVVSILWHINPSRLVNAKSIFIQIISSNSNNSV